MATAEREFAGRGKLARNMSGALGKITAGRSVRPFVGEPARVLVMDIVQHIEQRYSVLLYGRVQ